VLAAIALGHYGSWMAALVTGKTVKATVDSCVLAYGWNDYQFARCDGNWHQVASHRDGSTTHVASGPVIGLDVDAYGPVDTADGRLSGNYRGTHFAVLQDGAAIVVSPVQMVLGPISLIVVVLSSILLIRSRRSDRRAAEQPSNARPAEQVGS
jgi:hypothetical protein